MKSVFAVFILMLFGLLSRAEEEKIPSVLVQLSQGEYFSNIALVVDKSARQLEVWKRNGPKLVVLKKYPIDYGKSEGDKFTSNDLKTPEGVYQFEKLLEGPGLPFQEYGSRAFTMNYPNIFDQRNQKTGSGIWLHGIPDEKGLQRGSKGCVVVSNDSIKEISQYIKLSRTPIIVNSKVDYISDNDAEKQKQVTISWLKMWLKSWQSKNIDDYISFYDDSFLSRKNNKKMDKNGWKAYKNNLNKLYDNIKISISEPFIIKHDDTWEISFLQKYSSSNFEDFGEKTIYLKGTNGGLKIIAEDFENTTNPGAQTEFANYNFSCCEDSIGSTSTVGARN